MANRDGIPTCKNPIATALHARQCLDYGYKIVKHQGHHQRARGSLWSSLSLPRCACSCMRVYTWVSTRFVVLRTEPVVAYSHTRQCVHAQQG